LFDLAVSKYLIDGQSKVIPAPDVIDDQSNKFAAPEKHQSVNGLVELHWKVMVHMACVYLTKKQVSHTFWFYSITHMTWMMNAIPGKHSGCLASPCLLVHGVGHDEQIWVPLFLLAYFHHKKEGNVQQSKHQAHTMDGTVIGCSPTSNALLVYNPRNKQYYKPDSYCLDPCCLPGLAYPSIKYNGGLFCSLLHDENPQFEEMYPPGTRVQRIDPVTNMLISGTVMDIPFPIDLSDSSEKNMDLSYTILFDNGTTASIPLSQMASQIPPPPVTPMTMDGANSLLPPFFHLNSWITFKHKNQYHKGYLSQLNGIYRFSYKSHVNKRREDWGVPLPNLPSNWVNVCVKGILNPGHVSHSFLWSPSSSTPTTFDPVASFVSALNLHRDCPPSLLKALADTHPHREIWLESFFVEMRGIQNLDTYK
jgi:hypothetical protein